MSPIPKLDGEHRYQIGRDPVHLVISMIDGKPRLSMLLFEWAGKPLPEPARVHLATFRSEDEAMTLVQFLDDMLAGVNKAVEHYEKLAVQLSTPTDITAITHLLSLTELRHGHQN